MVELLFFLKTLPKVVGRILKHVLIKISTVFYSQCYAATRELYPIKRTNIETYKH